MINQASRRSRLREDVISRRPSRLISVYASQRSRETGRISETVKRRTRQKPESNRVLAPLSALDLLGELSLQARQCFKETQAYLGIRGVQLRAGILPRAPYLLISQKGRESEKDVIGVGPYDKQQTNLEGLSKSCRGRQLLISQHHAMTLLFMTRLLTLLSNSRHADILCFYSPHFLFRRYRVTMPPDQERKVRIGSTYGQLRPCSQKKKRRKFQS
jgi:hypothetical protein